MSKLFFSTRGFYPFLLATSALLLGLLACSAIGSPPETSAGAPGATAPAPVENPTSIAVTVQPALPEKRYLKLEFPPKVRAGDSDVVRLTLEIDDKGDIVPTAEVQGNVVKGEVIEIPNLYETHRVIAEARFDIAGMEVRPSELISEPISQGQTAVFFWSIRPAQTGIYRGTIWVYLRFVDKASGEESQKTVSAQLVEIQAVNFLGLPVNVARSTGVIGSLVGTVFGFPFFEDLVKILFRKRLKS